jgi:hypothetical protein
MTPTSPAPLPIRRRIVNSGLPLPLPASSLRPSHRSLRPCPAQIKARRRRQRWSSAWGRRICGGRGGSRRWPARQRGVEEAWEWREPGRRRETTAVGMRSPQECACAGGCCILQQLLQLLLELLQFRLLLQNVDGGGAAATAGDSLST